MVSRPAALFRGARSEEIFGKIRRAIVSSRGGDATIAAEGAPQAEETGQPPGRRLTLKVKCGLALFAVGREDVTGAAHGADDRRMVGIGLDLAPGAADPHVDRAVA